MTGGGAIMMGCPEWHSQIGITLIISDDGTYPSKLSGKFELLNRGVLHGLKSLNLDVEYCQDTTDITVKGRKIAGSGVHSTHSAILFHSTVLIDYDLLTMLRVGKFPEEKINEHLLRKMENGYTTVRRELKLNQIDPAHVEKIVSSIVNGYAESMNVEFTESGYTERERLLAEKLETEKYGNSKWILMRGAQGMGACFLK